MSEQQKKPVTQPNETPVPLAEPRPVKLTRVKEADGKLADAIPVAPVATAGVVPRLIHQNERAPAGVKRFAVRCKSPLRAKRYVLARNQSEAEAHYRLFEKLADEALVVSALPD